MRLRSLAAAPLALLLLAAAALPALAADPPADVVFDGTVTVVFDVGDPMDGADVTLTASREDLGADPVFQTLSATTDASGTATFTEVARPADGAPAVTLGATAHLERWTLEEGCLTALSFDGDGTADGAVDVTMPLTVSAVSSLVCDKILPGSLIGPDGEAFPVDIAAVQLAVDGQASVPGEFLLDEHGDFRVQVPMWDPALGATVSMLVVSPVTRTEPLPDDCEDSFALVATYEWELDDPFVMPDPVSVSAVEDRIGTVCGPATGTPSPTKTPDGAAPTGDAGPTITLPPTDTLGGSGTGGSDGVGLLLSLAAILATMAVAVGSAIRVSRRGS